MSQTTLTPEITIAWVGIPTTVCRVCSSDTLVPLTLRVAGEPLNCCRRCFRRQRSAFLA